MLGWAPKSVAEPALRKILINASSQQAKVLLLMTSSIDLKLIFYICRGGAAVLESFNH